MTFTLRHYQSRAVDATMAYLRRYIDPCMIDAAPASGKSFMIAAIANNLHNISGGKRVLCIAPSAELVKQNHEKYLMTGERASIFSASAGQKSTISHVVFGTPGTVKNSISRFTRQGQDGYCAVIIDECHGTTPTIRAIIDTMRDANPNLRIIGLSGTPYTLGGGYIYRNWPDGKANSDDTCRDPYYAECTYRVSAQEMFDEGFITPMVVGDINASAYDTSGIELLPNGTPTADSVERAFVGHGRRTAGIVADVIHQSRDRAGGIMYFAATIQHGQEILASLPIDSSALVTGDDMTEMGGKPTARNAVIAAYRAGKVRHLVSIGTLTTGFDVSHTEVIALLRYTESAALLQQIMGRAWRLDPAKADCLLLDYAGNVERHFPDSDIYTPKIKAGKAVGDGVRIDVQCPDCGCINDFKLNPENDGFKYDKHGYALDVFGEPIMTEYGPLPVHFGRRCFGAIDIGQGKQERCGYRWTGKPCPACGEKNDIAARYCYDCRAEIVDPNEKLISDFKAFKRDPHQPQTDVVKSMTCSENISQKGNKTLRVVWVTEFRQFSIWLLPESKGRKQQSDYAKFMDATNGGKEPPSTVSYVKDRDSQFYRVLAYDMAADAMPGRKAA